MECEDTMKLNKTAPILGFVLVLAMALPLRAQNGCVDSPEDPTVFLAMVGVAGAIATTLARRKRQ
jgi:XrtJ-associated TM-motif-TM protein